MFKTKNIPTFLLFIFIACCSHSTPSIQKIVTRDNNFEIITTIENTPQLKEVAAYWENLVSVDNLPHTKWTHKIDIESEQIGGRWLYNSEDGYLALLNVKLAPKYKVSDIEKFNKLFLTNQKN